MRSFRSRRQNSRVRAKLIFEQLENRQLLASDAFSLTAHQVPDWVDSESACLALANLLASANGGAASSSVAPADAGAKEIWIAPDGGDRNGDLWRSTSSGKAEFVFELPADAGQLTDAKVVGIARQTMSTEFDVAAAVDEQGGIPSASQAEIRHHGRADLVEGQIVEFDLAALFTDKRPTGQATMHIGFEAHAKQSLEIIGLRVQYATQVSAATAAPTVIGHRVNDGLDNRSRLRSVELEFDQNVKLDSPAAFRLTSHSTKELQDISAATVHSEGGNKVVLDLSEVQLANGFYIFELPQEGSSPALQQPYAFVDFVLRGDANGDQVVDFADFGLMSAHFGENVGRLGSGDLDGSGVVDFVDFGLISSNMGSVLQDTRLVGD